MIVSVLACGIGLSCVRSGVVECANGSLCPDSLQCALVDDVVLCVQPDQVVACRGRTDFEPCDLGLCYQQVCLPAGCGNGRVEPGEACDDENAINGDGCAADCASNETCGNGVIDLSRGEQCDDGPVNFALSHDGCSSGCSAVERAAWFVSPLLDQSSTTVAAYDSHRNRLVSYGTVQIAAQTLEWDGFAWTHRAPSISPSPRTDTAMAYDAARQRVVLFGGLGYSDTWEWDGGRWTLATPPVSPPSRGGHAMVYDPRRKRVVLFGGRTTFVGNGGVLADTWIWDGTTWTELSGPSPPARSDVAVAYDPRHDRIVLHGGHDASGGRTDGTWELAGLSWSQRSPATTPGSRARHAMGYDAASGRMLLHGGRNIVTLADTWAWDSLIGNWTLVASGPPASSHRLVPNTRNGRIMLVSGLPGAIHEWSGSGWIAKLVPIPPPSTFQQAGAVDLGRGRAVIHGGYLNGTALSSSTVFWHGTYSRFIGTTPGAVANAAMVYDVHRDEFVLFGGIGPTGDRAETWVFDGSAWTQRTPVSSPPARNGHVMVYDAARERIVMFGGSVDVGDTWLWDGVTWTAASSAGGPGPRMDAAATYDPVAETVVLFGGTRGTQALGDTWVWNGTIWELRVVAGPTPRTTSGMAWNPARKRIVLHGGAAEVLIFNDQWEWDGQRWSLVPAVGGLTPRYDHLLLPSIDGSGVTSFGGATVAGETIYDVAMFGWTSDRIQETCVRADLDEDGRGASSCVDDPDCWSRCTPTCSPGVQSPTTCGPASRTCGDASCDPLGEDCVTCPEDCATCPSTCGDLRCDAPLETTTSCPGDCP